MNVGMLGLDQSLLRFYHEPPAGSTGRSMFAACTRLSVLVMLLAGGIGSIFFAKPLAAAFWPWGQPVPDWCRFCS